MTQSSREDVLYSSKRNIKLLEWVADAFAAAIKKLCVHPSFKYTWMRYLPDRKMSGDFWLGVRQNTVSRLKSLAILEPLGDNQALMCPDQLKRLSPGLLDEESNPLLPSDGYIKFLSLRYLPQDYKRLKWLGSTDVTSEDLLELLAHDLQHSSSRWRSFIADHDWQRRLSSLLLNICREFPQLKLRLQKMNLVALQGGE